VQWICYIAGLGRKGDFVVIQIALAEDPNVYLAALKPTQPYELRLLGSEPGTEELLEERRAQFRSGFRNGWVKPSPELLAHVEALPEADPKLGALKKVCVDWTPAEVLGIEQGVERMGLKTKTRLIRRAVRFFLGLTAYHAKGWTIQAVKGGRFVQFKDLDDIEEPSEVPTAADLPKAKL
jgi:hypothetical protein